MVIIESVTAEKSRNPKVTQTQKGQKLRHLLRHGSVFSKTRYVRVCFFFVLFFFCFSNQKSTCFEHCTDFSFLHAYQRPIACRMGTGIRSTRPCVLWCLHTTMKMPQRRVAHLSTASQSLTSMRLGPTISQRSGFESGAGLPSATSASIGGGLPK